MNDKETCAPQPTYSLRFDIGWWDNVITRADHYPTGQYLKVDDVADVLREVRRQDHSLYADVVVSHIAKRLEIEL